VVQHIRAAVMRDDARNQRIALRRFVQVSLQQQAAIRAIGVESGCQCFGLRFGAAVMQGDGIAALMQVPCQRGANPFTGAGNENHSGF